jgi:hypothetical protein
MTTNNSDSNHNDNPKIIKLEQSEALKRNGLIINSVYYINTNNIKISLNHTVNEDIIFTIDKKKWQNNLNTIVEQAEEFGIHDNESKKLLKSHLNDNHEVLVSTTAIQREEDSQNEEEEDKSLPHILVKLVLENSIRLFKDEFNVPHILVTFQNCPVTLSIDSTKFKRYISKLYYDTFEGRIANTEAINSAVTQLEAKAFYEGQTIPLHLRVAWDNPDTRSTIYYDLSDEKNRCVKVTNDGWKIIDNQIEVLFRKYNHLKPQIEPITATATTTINNIDGIDTIDSKIFNEFISLFNMKNNKEKYNTLLLRCYIISLFIPDIPKPILLLHGEQGGAKSTFQELIQIMVDPSITQTLTFPRNSNEFIQQLSHNYIAYYDNVSTIQDWISDLLCRAVTGSSFSKRALYTNDDDIYYNFKRIIGINGIDLAATKADLLDRSIIIQTERIDKKDRIKIEKIWEKFNRIKPCVLGYIFDILAKVLQYKAEHGEIDFPNGLNRMADWEEYGEIISRCMGNPEGEFQRVYQENIGVQIDEAIESSPLSQAIIELMSDEIIKYEETAEEKVTKPKEPLTMTPSDLHRELEHIAINKLNLSVSKSKSWPKSASHLTRRINGIKTNLREKGIEITVGKDEKGKRTITISKVPSMSSMSSKTTDLSTKQEEKRDSKSDNEQVLSQMLSTKNNENQAQNPSLDSKDSIDRNLQRKTGKEQEEKRRLRRTFDKEKYRREQEEQKNWNIGLE